MDDPVRIESLDGAHRLTVVTELPVVVVLQDEPAAGTGPVDHGRTPFRVQRTTRRELVGRGEQHTPYARQSGQLAGTGPVFVDRQRDRTDPGGDQQRTVESEPVRLHRQRAAQHTAAEQQPKSVREAGADHDPFGGAAHPADARQIAGQRAAQLEATLWITGAEGVVRRGVHGAAGGREPCGTGEGRGVRLSLTKVVHGRGRTGRRLLRDPGRGGGSGAVRDPGAGPLTGGQPALGDQFGIGVGDGITGQAEVGGERAVGRQPGAGRQSSRPDRVAQRADENGPAAARSSQLQQQVTADPLRRIDP